MIVHPTPRSLELEEGDAIFIEANGIEVFALYKDGILSFTNETANDIPVVIATKDGWEEEE